jgi:hypothetical protein
MKKKSIAIPAIITLLCCITSGCVTRTTVKDEPRQSVQFASAQAAQTFYDAYISHYYQSSAQLTVALPLPYTHSKLVSDDVRFNHAVQLADTNHDGIISESEAQAYAEKVKEPSN